MTYKEKELLTEYRYKKLCRLEDNNISSGDVLNRSIDNKSALSGHFCDVVALDTFKIVMNEVFELLKLN